MSADNRKSLPHQIAANARWAKEDPTQNAVRGQAGLTARFEREVDPDNSLAPRERARRVDCARKAHFGRLALASAKARQLRKKADELDRVVQVEVDASLYYTRVDFTEAAERIAEELPDLTDAQIERLARVIRGGA